MADVFISYAREDRAVAAQVAGALQALGIQAFWDTEIPPGQAWDEYIESKLTGCRAVVVLWSQHSIKSEWVREEARLGKERAQLIPAMIDGSPPPFGFGGVQAANLSDWTGDPNHLEWRRLAGAVQAACGAPPAAQPPQARAPQPQAPPHAWSQPAPQPRYGAAPAASLSPIGYIQKCFRLFVNGKGRARRAEYAWWLAFVVALSIAIMIVEVVLFGYNEFTETANDQTLSTLATLALLAPWISVTSRRLHDLGQSGWLAAALFGSLLLASGLVVNGEEAGNWLSLIVLAAAVALAALPGQAGANAHGPDPKA